MLEEENVARMSNLSGTLESISLAPLVGFLAGLRKSGRLSVSDGPWAGSIFLEEGRVVGAAFGAERGLDALDAIALALAKGQFAYAEDDASDVELNLMMSPAELQKHLGELAQEGAALSEAVPSLAAVPTVVVQEPADDSGEVRLDRATLKLLLALDGGRTVAELAAHRGVIRTLRELAHLVELNLVRLNVAAPADGRVPPPTADKVRAIAGDGPQQRGHDQTSIQKGVPWLRKRLAANEREQ